jgi:hypothetical protein
MPIKVFKVQCVEQRLPHYVPACVEFTYSDGTQTVTFSLGHRIAREFAEDLLAAAKVAEERHQSACERGLGEETDPHG